ncbi:hypothetical protein, variant [Aphanomyces invadans]|uniref:Golgi apparatus membrane protein TVP15 n=1 Tax=Aphanomyces invadans TaxID=157072 RepID=A0A024UMT7_9STRA|nr:hypothetical protein H310_01985 [Aphanomyces invadans]XP_008863569.1 hypothetical protein, variant [Aphanomyces invadans]ETW07475.1 hypothetical protein H310_01985 [Aphanomyces invadans]ETW07476.1 hypothetical protein, variant [Aphanomyces invadans]|eukprot:XP_008863568.1 hypothetical protein H310_01985 [Aphanomyces invadans]
MSNPFEDPSVRMAATSPEGAAKKLPIPQKQSSFKAAPVAPAHASVINPAQVGNSAPPPGTPKTAAENLMEEVGSSIKKTDSAKILRVMQTINIILAALTVTAGILSWVAGYVVDFQTFIASSYIITFGLLLLGFELRTATLDVLLRANFGFMYGYKTRTIFLLFIAIWPLSMGTYWVTILDAVLLFLNAFFNYFVISSHPAFSGEAPPAYDATRVSLGTTATTLGIVAPADQAGSQV